MPPAPYGFSVGAPHIPQIPVDVYGEPQWLAAGASAFERAEYATALTCFQRAGAASALGRFDAGLAEVYLGNGGGLNQMKYGVTSHVNKASSNWRTRCSRFWINSIVAFELPAEPLPTQSLVPELVLVLVLLLR